MAYSSPNGTVSRFQEKGEKMLRFLDEHKSLPSKRGDAAERSLARWWDATLTKMQHEGLKSEGDSQIIESLLKHPSASLKSVVKWEARHAELQQFYADHGRLPRSIQDGTKTPESSLGKWMIMQRMALKAGKMKPERVSKLSEIPGALETATVAPTDQRLEEASKWCADHGYLPRANPSKNLPFRGEDREEAAIANWMRNHARVRVLKHETPEVVRRRDSINELYSMYPSRSEWNTGVRHPNDTRHEPRV